MIHRFRMPDFSQGGEPREIVWNDDAPSVTGDHYQVAELRDKLANASDVGKISHYAWWCPTPDPWRDPAQFLVVLQTVLQARYDPSGVPASLRGVVAARRRPIERPNRAVQ